MASANKRCFVISPIGEENSPVRNHADDVFRFIIEPAMREYGIQAVRSDHMKEAGRISRQMFREIFTADICIALLTGHNPNVFYELAVAQCAARPLIILIEAGQVLPFDVKDMRCIYYETSPVSRLVDGFYAERVIQQLQDLKERGWIVPGLFEQFGPVPQFRTEQQVRHFLNGVRPKPLPTGTEIQYKIPFDTDDDKRIVVVTGDFIQLPKFKFDVVVSLENTYMQLGHYFDLSLSGKLRFLDAHKKDGRVLEDSLNNSLQKHIEQEGIQFPVPPASVIALPTCQLEQLYGIKWVFHVAALTGSVGEGYEMMDGLVDDCVRNVFNKFDELAKISPFKTMLMPMLGAFATRLDHLDLARSILKPVVFNLSRHTECQTIYLHAWVESHLFSLRQVASEMKLLEI